MTVINLFFNLPDEIKTIIWQYDPTYTIVKRDLCYYLRCVSNDFYSSNKSCIFGLRGLVAFGRGEELPVLVHVVSPSYIKESLIRTNRAWKSLGIRPKTVKEILHCSEEDKECKDYLNLYIRSIHKINIPVSDVSEYTSNEIKQIMEHTGCTRTQAINAFKNNDYDIVNAIMELEDVDNSFQFPTLRTDPLDHLIVK